eukprot:273011-Prorocentrum_minimum.AAC.1
MVSGSILTFAPSRSDPPPKTGKPENARWDRNLFCVLSLASTEGRARILAREKGDRGIKSDILILEGWPENASPPTGPEKWWVGAPGAQRRKVTVHIAEEGFSSDFSHRRKYESKQLHYQPLMEELEKAGWNVHRK